MQTATREAAGIDDVRPSAELEAEVLRINLRFNVEVIEAFTVCPYARGSRNTGTSHRRVAWLRELDVEAFLAIVEDVEKDETGEVAQVVLPLLRVSVEAFLEFAAEMGRRNAARKPGRPAFVHAAFHPELPYATDAAPRLVPFFRRSPDPTIQLVRLGVLDAIHEGKPRGTQFFDGPPEAILKMLSEKPESVTDRITRENHENALAGDLERIAAVVEDIARDRQRSYARFGLVT